MNLLYIWSEENEVIGYRKKGFTFTGKYHITYDAERNTISIIKNKDFAENFWVSNIFDICAIVGENGSGKTLLSNYIISSIGYLENAIESYDYFIIFEDEIENKINIYVTEKYRKMEKGNSEIAIELFTERPFDVFLQYKLAYFTNALSRSDYQYKKMGYVTDFSVGGLMSNNYRTNVEMHYKRVEDSIIQNYYSCEFEKVTKFIFYFTKHNNLDIPFPMPKFIEILLNNYSLNIEYIMKQIKSMIDSDKKVKNAVDNTKFDLSSIIHLISQKYKGNWVNTLIINLMINIFKEIAIPQTTGVKKGKEVVAFIKIFEAMKKCDTIEYPTIYDFMKRYLNYIDQSTEIQHYNKWAVKNYREFNIWIEKNEGFLLKNSSVIDWTCYISTTKDNEKLIFELLEHYKNTSFPFLYFSFNCGLSTGEYNFLNIFSNMFSMFKVDSNGNRKLINDTEAGQIECKNVLLLFDEADLSLHPRWQQKFLLWIIQFTTSLFQGVNIQIIITTHSPIMLSDFPRDNVIYLDKNIDLLTQDFKRNIKTFGNNIHTLFLDSFFLSDEGTVGAFAEMKINEIAHELIEGKVYDSDKNILKMINYVGDDLVHNKLMEFYNMNMDTPYIETVDYINNVDTIDTTIGVLRSQIEQLRSTIAELEKIKNDKNTIR
jgi:predicted ATPase